MFSTATDKWITAISHSATSDLWNCTGVEKVKLAATLHRADPKWGEGRGCGYLFIYFKKLDELIYRSPKIMYCLALTDTTNTQGSTPRTGFGSGSSSQIIWALPIPYWLQLFASRSFVFSPHKKGSCPVTWHPIICEGLLSPEGIIGSRHSISIHGSQPESIAVHVLY